jgi:hypothetical protein
LRGAPTLPPKASTVRFAFHRQSLVVPKSPADDAGGQVFGRLEVALKEQVRHLGVAAAIFDGELCPCTVASQLDSHLRRMLSATPIAVATKAR